MPLPTTNYATATLVNPTAALTDFTLMVDLSRMPAEWWAAVDTSDGTRGRAAKDDGTELACDWLDFDSVGGTGWLRVKWSGTLATTGMQTLRVYPPNAGNAAVATGDAIGQYAAYADRMHYWPSVEEDRIGNGDLTILGSPTEYLDGNKVGKAKDFVAAADKSTGSLAGSLGTSFGIGFWAKMNISTFTNCYWFMASGTDLLINTPRPGFWTGGSDAGTQGPSSSPTFVDQGWHFFFGTYGSGQRNLYLDGSLYSSLAGNPPSQPNNAFTFNANNRSINSRMQDATIYSVEPTAAWIRTEFEQTDDQVSFWGVWENNPAAGGRRRAMVVS